MHDIRRAIKQSGVTTITYWILVLLLILVVVIIALISATNIAYYLLSIPISLMFIIVYYGIFHKNDYGLKIASIVWGILIALVALQVSVPIISPIVDVSLGDTVYGYVYGTYATTLRDFKIDIKPPLLLTKLNSLNCRDYDLVPIKNGYPDAMLEPIRMYLKNNFSEHQDNFYRTISICLDSSKELDAWKLGTLSTSIYLESIQPVRLFHPNVVGARNADNNQYVERLTELNKTLYYTDIFLLNDESYPVRFWTSIQIKNDTVAYGSLLKLVSDNSCKNIFVYPVLELDNFTKINEPIKIGDGTILGNYSINLGDTAGFLNMDHLEPHEKKIYYLVFECEK